MRGSSYSHTNIFMFSYYFLLALMFASMAGHDAIASVLLQNGAGELVRNQQGQNALHLAASYGRMAVVQRLIDHRANMLRSTDNQEHTILHFMIAGRHWDAFDPWLERLGMDDKTMFVRQDDAQGNNALSLAVRASRISGVLMFLSFCVQPSDYPRPIDRGADRWSATPSTDSVPLVCQVGGTPSRLVFECLPVATTNVRAQMGKFYSM
jgi:hypothetical protein